MMERGVYSLAQQGIFERLLFYPQIMRHAFKHNFNPEPLLQWAYLSDHYFQRQSHQALQDLNRCHVPFNFSLFLGLRFHGA